MDVFMEREELSKKYRTWVEIDRAAVAKNFHSFRSLVPPKTELLAVVKSNAYGHDIIGYSRELEKLGVDRFGVDSAVEALVLRKKGITRPILVLGYTLPIKFPDVAEQRIDIALTSFEQIEAIVAAGLAQPVSVHVKVDTGMHRQGFMLPEAKKLFERLSAAKDHIAITGLFTHFAAAKDPRGPDETKKQIEEFVVWKRMFKEEGYTVVAHASATSGTLLYPEAHFDMVRIGIGLYGLWPAKEVRAYAEKNITLEPTLSWRSIISEVKDLPAGSRIGYDFTGIVEHDSRIAICPVGYWHGYVRALSNRASVLVHGKQAHVIGRVSMGMIAIDVTGIPDTRVGDVATLIGKDGDGRIFAEDLAKLAGTIGYEIITGINPRIVRVFV